MLKIKLLNTIILSFISLGVFGQIFDSEQNPLSVKFRKIYTDGFTILYPTELEKEAQRMANTLTKIYPEIAKDFKLQKTTIPIVLQNRGTTANGFVQLAPKKAQFYTTPPQQFDSQDWLNNLAVHELRHVAQFDKITGKKGKPFPEEIYFAYMGAAVPTWFFEGDAVNIETSLTKAGRGRQPSWVMPFRTSLLSGKKISYSKAYFGSNKDIAPGYYQLGYLMVTEMQKKLGASISDSLLSDINKRPLRLYPFSGSLKKYSSKNTKQFYEQTVASLKTAWQTQADKNVSENYEALNRPAKIASNYFLPTEIEKGKILALKQTKSEAPRFIIINEKKIEQRLFKIAYQEQPWYSYHNGILVWDEIRQDPRFKQRSYSVVCIYDFATKKKKQLSFKTRLFSPSVSGDGKKIIAVQIDLSNQINLVILESQSGKIIETIPNPENLQLQTPSLNEDGSKITYVSVSESGKALWIVDGKANTKIIEDTNQQISRPIFIGQQIAFNAHLSGIDNIYSISIADRKITALTSSKYGAFNASPSLDGRDIYFNNFEATGYNIAKVAIRPKPVQENHFVYFGKTTEPSKNIFSDIPDSTFASKRYSRFSNLFNFHSISPTIDENERVGLQLKSTDLLNNFDFFTGVSYHSDLRKLEYNAGFSLKTFYPVVSATFRNRPRLAYYRNENAIYEANWRENFIELTAAVPLSINAYNHNYSFLGSIGTSYTKRNFDAREAKLFSNNLNFPMSYRFAFSHSVRAAERDVAPRWAQSFSFGYFNQPFDKRLNGDLFAFGSTFYFPGVARNHSFTASFNYQESSGSLRFNNEINTVFGYGQINAKSILKNTLLLNYRFPFAFPDTEIGSLAYIRNLRGGFFAHYENIGNETNFNEPKTFGLELRSSMNLLRYQPVVDLGARLVLVNKTYRQNPIMEFIFNYSF